MAYTGKKDEQNPNQMFPAQEKTDPGFVDRMAAGVKMDFPGASMQGAGDALMSAAELTPVGMSAKAIAALGSALTARDSRQPYPMSQSGGGAGVPQAPSTVPMAKDPGTVLPPLPTQPAKGRNRLAEVEAMDRGTFNAERDTPRSPHEGYVPPMRATMTNPWDSKGPAVADKGLVYQELMKEGRNSGDMTIANDYQKTLLAQVHSMLPGASPKEVRSIMNTISQSIKNPNAQNPTQPGQAQAAGEQGSLAQAVAQSQQPAPNYQKLGAGQSIYQMHPDGRAQLLTTAPGGANEPRQGDAFKQQQNQSVHTWDRVKKEYDRTWDKITENVAEGPEREKALRSLNVNHFRSLGVPEELATVPVSFKSYLSDHLTTLPPGQQKFSREQTEALTEIHKRKVMMRNSILKKRFSNTLSFD